MRIGIPDLDRFDIHRGIGRATTTIVDCWSRWGHEVVSLQVLRTRVPVVRNFAWGLSGSVDDVDVILVPDLLDAGLLCFASRRIPSVVMIHDFGALDCDADRLDATSLTGPLYHWSLLGASQATLVTTVSDFTRDRLLLYKPQLAQKAVTVHYGVDHSVFYPRARGAARRFVQQRGVQIPAKAFVLIYVGAEYRRKNVTTLLAAFSTVRRRLPGALLVKVGAAYSLEDRQRTEDAITSHELQHGRDIQLVEDADDELLAHLYNAAHVFVSASLYEGFGLPLVEAMASGLPCVVSNAGALPEVGGDAALYVDPDDAAGFADRMEEVARSQHDDLAARALERAAQFDWQKTAQGILRVLKAAAGG